MDFFDADASYTESPMKPNGAIFNREKGFAYAFHKDTKIESVRLRGSWKSGEHQELLIKLVDGIFVRISRTNGNDTFQVGAVESGRSKSPMPNLINATPVKSIKCSDAFKAFADARSVAPRYEQADCHTFAQTIMASLCPQVAPNLQALDTEDFM